MVSNTELLLRLALACVLSGLIGMERERNRHPAGLRTHILVCVGATLIMLTNHFIFEKFRGLANMDPARLGAQVISGIGFLGAGTIIKEGLSIRGLTTAASLWTVAGLGIAIGTGFYSGAIIATLFILIILMFFTRFEYLFYSKNNRTYIVIKSENLNNQINLIATKLNELEIHYNNISAEEAEDNLMMLSLKVTSSNNISNNTLIQELYKLQGIKYVQIRE